MDALRRLGPLPGRAGDNPLVLLGELDQLGEAAAEALLRALDPVSNRAFRDRYVGLPLDLAGVLLVASASDPGRIPPLLRERLEVLPLAGYTDAEKQLIAVRHLVPHRVATHGLSAEDLSFSPAALGLLTGGYVREPGVRGLDDLIDTGLPQSGPPAGGRSPAARGDGAGDGWSGGSGRRGSAPGRSPGGPAGRASPWVS